MLRKVLVEVLEGDPRGVPSSWEEEGIERRVRREFIRRRVLSV